MRAVTLALIGALLLGPTALAVAQDDSACAVCRRLHSRRLSAAPRHRSDRQQTPERCRDRYGSSTMAGRAAVRKPIRRGLKPCSAQDFPASRCASCGDEVARNRGGDGEGACATSRQGKTGADDLADRYRRSDAPRRSRRISQCTRRRHRPHSPRQQRCRADEPAIQSAHGTNDDARNMQKRCVLLRCSTKFRCLTVFQS